VLDVLSQFHASSRTDDIFCPREIFRDVSLLYDNPKKASLYALVRFRNCAHVCASFLLLKIIIARVQLQRARSSPK